MTGVGDRVQRKLASPRFDKDPTLIKVEAGTKVVASGSKDRAVLLIQHALYDLGYSLPAYGADQDFGSETKAAVKGDGRPARAGGANTTPDTGPYGEAGAPPASPKADGRPLSFGRYRGWTLNQVDRYDHGYIEWLSRTTMGRTYKRELDVLLRRVP